MMGRDMLKVAETGLRYRARARDGGEGAVRMLILGG